MFSAYSCFDIDSSMANLNRISVIVIAYLLSEVNSITIFQGLSVKKGIDISLIPFPLKSITFIKEKWTPFGGFGMKHEIARRQVADGVEPDVILTPVPVLPPYIIPPVPRPEILPVAPVVEHQEDIPHENIDHVPPEVPIITPSVAPVVEDIAPEIPVSVVVEEPVAPFVPEVAVTPAEAAPVLLTPIPHVPIQAPPIGTVVPQTLPNNLNTDISRAPAINDYLNSVEKPPAPVVPPVKEVKAIETPSLFGGIFPSEGLRKGSKLAIQLGSAFLHYMSQIFSSPHSPIARFAAS